MFTKFSHCICALITIVLLSLTVTPAHAFPWGLLSKLGSSAGKVGASAAKVGTSAAKAGGAAAKAGAAAKVGGAAAKVGVGKATTMTAAGAVAGDAAIGGKAAAHIGASADDMVVGGRAAALGSVTDDGGRAAALGGEAAEVPMGKFNTRRRLGVGVESGTEAGSEGRWSSHAKDAADAASNVAGYEGDDDSGTNEEVSTPGSRSESIFMMLFGLSLFGLALNAVTKKRRS